MKHTQLKTRLALCTVGVILFASCSASNTAPLADSPKLPPGPTLPPVEQTGTATTVVAWDPSKEASAIPTTEAPIFISPEDEAAAAAVVTQLFERSLRKEAPELILGNLERSDEFVAAAKANPVTIKREIEVSIESVTRLNDLSCVDLAAQPGCIDVRFYLVADGKPFSRELRAHVYKKGDTWVWSAYSFCNMMYNLREKCLIDVPKAPFELRVIAGGSLVTTTTLVND
jgi:hypothetical protein